MLASVTGCIHNKLLAHRRAQQRHLGLCMKGKWPPLPKSLPLREERPLNDMKPRFWERRAKVPRVGGSLCRIDAPRLHIWQQAQHPHPLPTSPTPRPWPAAGRLVGGYLEEKSARAGHQQLSGGGVQTVQEQPTKSAFWKARSPARASVPTIRYMPHKMPCQKATPKHRLKSTPCIILCNPCPHHKTHGGALRNPSWPLQKPRGTQAP